MFILFARRIRSISSGRGREREEGRLIGEGDGCRG